MMKRSLPLHELVDQVIAVTVLIILVLYTYVYFVLGPYTGIGYASNGRVVSLYVEGGIQVGDRLVQVGPESWKNYETNLHRTLTAFHQARPGDVIPIRIQRNDQPLDVAWKFPGFTPREFWINRVPSQWLLAYIFWGAGVVALLLLRPRLAHQRLFVFFCFLTALWLMMSNVSRWHLWGSALALRSAIWLSVPVYWHLHWIFPQPLKRLPAAIAWVLYLIGVSLATAEWFQILPTNFYLWGLLLALAGSLGLLAAHLIFQPLQRRKLAILFLGAGLALAPPILIGLAGTLFPALVTLTTSSTIAALPIFPLIYLYTIYRGQLGGLELRANRFIAVYIFLVAIGLTAAIADGLINAFLTLEGKDFLADFAVPVLAAGAAIFVYPRFQRFVERRWLGIPRAPARLLETYASRIVTTLDVPSLVHLLTDKVLPSLLVRQFAFLSLDDDNRSARLCALGVEAARVPGDR